MFPLGFEPAIPESERLQTYASDHAATGFSQYMLILMLNLHVAESYLRS